MHVEHEAEIGERHLGEPLVAQDAGVVDEDVDPAPGVERLRATIAATARPSVTEA